MLPKNIICLLFDMNINEKCDNKRNQTCHSSENYCRKDISYHKYLQIQPCYAAGLSSSINIMFFLKIISYNFLFVKNIT